MGLKKITLAEAILEAEKALGTQTGVGDPNEPDNSDEPDLGPEQRRRLRRITSEMVRRQKEGLRLYEALPVVERFHADTRDERLIRGSNRAGKTLAAAVEVARAVTGTDPYHKYPKTNGRAAVVAQKLKQVGEVVFRKLFKPGAFRIIRDQYTRRWRAFRPATDQHRIAEARPAGPLIPRRLVVDISWKKKKENIPAMVRLKNGWEINFYSSEGTPPNGIDIDLLWIDEEIENEAWWPEMVARLLDRRGKAIWSATPQCATEHLYNLHLRAEECPDLVGEHVILLEDNPHIDFAEKKKLESRLVSEEERRVRIKGEFAMSGYRVYPNFDMRVHGFDPSWPINGAPPKDWSRYMVVDPGRQICAVLFAAVPPPYEAKGVYLYHELYIKNCDAAEFGKRVAEVYANDPVLPDVFIIDGHAGRVTEIGSGLNVESQFVLALRNNRIRCTTTGSGFIWGLDDVKAGILAVHSYLRLQDDGKPLLFVARNRLPNFENEIQRYHYRKVNRLVSDMPEKRHDHLMDCLRYLCAAQPVWRKPTRNTRTNSYAINALKEKLRRIKKQQGSGSQHVRLGPGVTYNKEA